MVNLRWDPSLFLRPSFFFTGLIRKIAQWVIPFNRFVELARSAPSISWPIFFVILGRVDATIIQKHEIGPWGTYNCTIFLDLRSRLTFQVKNVFGLFGNLGKIIERKAFRSKIIDTHSNGFLCLWAKLCLNVSFAAVTNERFVFFCILCFDSVARFITTELLLPNGSLKRNLLNLPDEKK